MPRRQKMPPYLVIRPSGVWNTRAPMHEFVLGHRAHNKLYHLLTLSILRLRFEAELPANEQTTLRRFFRTRDVGLIAERARQGFKLSFPPPAEGKRTDPSLDVVANELERALNQVRQSSIVAYVSLFETFALCWALNYLLARLEGDHTWTRDECAIAESLSPIHTNTPPPGWPFVSRRIGELETLLRSMARVVTDPDTGAETPGSLVAVGSAYDAMIFWRDFRNLVVHRGNRISREFLRKHGEFFELLRKPYAKYLSPLKRGAPLLFPDAMFRAMATTHYKAAREMNEWLLRVSQERRGHLLAPKMEDPAYRINGTEKPPALLLEGDHPPSYQSWTQSRGSSPAYTPAED